MRLCGRAMSATNTFSLLLMSKKADLFYTLNYSEKAPRLLRHTYAKTKIEENFNLPYYRLFRHNRTPYQIQL